MIALLILIPMAGAVAAWLAKRGAHFVGIGTGLATVLCSLVLATGLWVQEAQRHAMGGWFAPLGIELHWDGLAAVLVVLTGVVGMFITGYAAVFLRLEPAREHRGRLFWPVWLLLWGGLNGLFLSGDIFNVYVLLEVITLAAVSLAVLEGGRAALEASLRYLLSAMTGSMAYLLGVALLYAEHGLLDMHALGAALHPGLVSAAAFSLMTVGLLIKTALFPLHFWLPPAHSSALAPVSAALSGLVVKASFYVLVRLWFDVFAGIDLRGAAQCLGALGAAAILWGSFQALRQSRIKLVVAHSTVGQIGYLFLLFPLAIIAPGGEPVGWVLEAWTGGLYQAFSHGLAKASLFLAAGVILHATGSDNLSSMQDIAGRLPVTTFTLGLAGMSLIGLPPSGGFVAKWMFLQAIIASGQWWWAPVVLAGGLLTAGYVFLMLRSAFIPMEQQLKLRPVPRLLEWTALGLALSSVLIGFRVEDLIGLLQASGPARGLEVPE